MAAVAGLSVTDLPVRLLKNKRTRQWQLETPPGALPPPAPPRRVSGGGGGGAVVGTSLDPLQGAQGRERSVSLWRLPPNPQTAAAALAPTASPPTLVPAPPSRTREPAEDGTVMLLSSRYGPIRLNRSRLLRQREREQRERPSSASSSSGRGGGGGGSGGHARQYAAETQRGVKLMEPLLPCINDGSGRARAVPPPASSAERDAVGSELKKFESALRTKGVVGVGGGDSGRSSPDDDDVSGGGGGGGIGLAFFAGGFLGGMRAVSRESARAGAGAAPSSAQQAPSKAASLRKQQLQQQQQLPPGAVSPMLRSTYARNFFSRTTMGDIHAAYMSLYKTTEKTMVHHELKALCKQVVPHCDLGDGHIAAIMACFPQDKDDGSIRFMDFFAGIGSLVYGDDTHDTIRGFFQKLEDLGPVVLAGSIPTARLTARHIEHLIRDAVPGLVVHRWLNLCERIEAYFDPHTREVFPHIDLDTFLCFVYLRDDLARAFVKLVPKGDGWGRIGTNAVGEMPVPAGKRGGGGGRGRGGSGGGGGVLSPKSGGMKASSLRKSSSSKTPKFAV